MAGNNNMSAMDRLLSEVRSGQAKPASQSSARTQIEASPRSSSQSASDSTISSLQRRLAEADKRIADDNRSRKKSGVYNAVSAVGDYLPILESRREQLKADRDSIAADIEDIRRSRQEINKSGGYGKGGIGAAFQRGVGQAQSTQNALEALIGDVEQEDLEGIVAGRTRVQNNARNKSEQDAYERFQAADGFLASAREIFTNPRLLANVAIESIPSSMYSMVGGVVGGVGGAVAGTAVGGPAGTVIGGRVGGAAGSGIGSFATEYGSAMLETFERNGIDLDDPEALKAAIDDPKLMEEAKERGLRRGIAVAAFDALSVGLAGKLGGGQIARRVGGDIAEAGAGRRAGSVLAGGAAETVSQGALGAGGEASAQLLADGRITSPQDIVAEFAGELPTGAVEATVGTGAEYLRKDTANQPNAMEDEELAAALAARGEANPVREGGGLLEDQNAVALRGLGNISAGGMNYTPDQILDIARNNESNPRIADIMSQPVSDVTKVEQVARILNQEEAARVEPEAIRRISGMFGGSTSVSNSRQMIGDELAKINPAIIAESPALSAVARTLETADSGKQFVNGLRNVVSNYQPTAQTGTLFARPERGGEGSVIMSQEDVTNEAQREREAQQAFRLADVRQRRFDTATGELTQREDLRAGAPEPQAQFFLNPEAYGEDLGGIAATIVGAEGGKVRIQYESPTEVDGNGTPVIISEDVEPSAMFDRVVRGTARMTQELAGDVRKPRKGTGTNLNPRRSVDRTSTRALVPTESGLPATISPTRMTGFEANTDQMPVEQQVQNAQVNPQQERPVNLEGNVEGPNEISGAPAQIQAPTQNALPAPAQEEAPAPAQEEAEAEAPTQDVGRKVEKHVENIEDKILNDDRNGVVRYADKVHKEGLIDDADLAEIKRMSKDKDMGAEDIGPELISQLNTKRDGGGTSYSGRRDVVRPKAKKASDVVRDTPLTNDAKAAPEAEAKPEIDYEAVIQDRLDKLAARGGQGKIVSRRLRSLLKKNDYNPTQLYYAFQMGEVVSRVLPSNSKVDVLFVPSITATDAGAAAASGIDLGAEASGAYRAYSLSQNGFRGLITLSLSENLTNVARENAAHEAFHVIQDFLRVDAPYLYDIINASFYDGMRINDLDASILRKLKTLKTDREGSVYDSLIEDFGDTPLGGFEAQAVAFGALVDAKDRGVDMKGLKASFIRYVDFLSDMLRGFRNIFRVNRVDSVAEIFEGFRTGEISQGFTEPAPFAESDYGVQYSGRVPKNPAVTSSLEHNFNILQNKSFRKGRDLKMFMQERVKSSLEESGINAENYDAEDTFKYLTKMAVKDAEYALQENANAIGWYDEKVSKALAVLSLVHPEIATDRQSKFAFIWALAVSSNGLKVNPNFEIAEKAYRIYKETGQMPTDIGIGTAADAIDGHMKLFNVMMEKLGFDELERLMTTKATVKEIESETGIPVSGEGKAEVVFGAAILGPKIGNGFFANLYGHFDQLTMDRWLMRTWGRWTGTLVSVKEQNVEKGRDILSRLVAALSDEQRSELGKIIGVDVAEADADTIALAVQKSSIKPANRTKISDIGRGNTSGLEDIVGKQKGRFEQVGLGDEIRKKGNGLAGYLDGQKEAPAGASERKYIRSVFQSTLATLKKKYPKLTTADLQALLWYPEKRLYEAAKTDEVNEGYDDDNAPDYANAAILVAKNAGVSDEQIRQANDAVDARLRSNVSSAGAGRGGAGVSEQYSGRTERADQDLATKLRSRFEGTPRVEEGSPAEGNVGRRSGGVLANSVTGRVPVAATYSHSTPVKDLFNENGFDTPDFHELTRGKAAGKLYTRLINDSKQDNRFGASVYVYPENEYQDMRLFVTKDGMSGFALKGDDIVSAFKSPKSADRGVAFSMIRMAVALGGRKLDAFDTVLPSIYSVSGFKAVARMRWNDEFKPDDWNKDTFKAFNGGEPDVVFMAYDQNREGLYSPDEGEYTDSYDQAVAAQGGDVQYSGRRGSGNAQAGPQALRPAYSFRSDNYNFGGEAPDKLDEVIYNLQDKLIDVKRIQKNIKDAGGRISETTDVYRAEELFHGRAAKRAKDFVQRELNPLLEEMKTKGVPLETLDKFLHARHAKERNAQIRKINPDMQDNGSGMSDAAADSYLAGLPNARRKQLEKLADRVDAITKSTQDMMVKYGLETQETIDNWNKTYKNYVPLQREGFEDGGAGSSGQGMSVRGSSSRRALGSELGVVDILANIAMQRERVISRGERNRVGNALTALALQNPNDSFWFVIDPKSADAAKAKQKLIDFGMDPADAENVMGAPMTSYMDTNSGRLVKRPNSLFMSSPFVMATRINGEDKFIAFNSRNPRSQRMVTALKNIDAFQMGAFVSGIAKVTRYFASINTQYNPAFGLYNLLRDLGGASINLSSTAIAGKQRQVIGNALPAALGMYRDLRSERSGKTATTNWAALADEFELEGGKTGFRDLFTTSQDRADAIEIELTGGSKLRQVATKVGGPVFDWLSDFNEAIENGVRLSAYKTAKEAGLSKAEAASIAKNLTVNFNRKGVVGSQAGAFYAFFNASVQGTARLAETLKGPAGKKIIAGGLLLGVAQAVALAAAGIDDEIPDWLKDKNLVIPLGGKKYFAIPMPLGLHVIPSFGRRSVEFFMSGGEKAPEQIIGLMGMMADSFNPIGNAGLSLQTVTPTVLDPLAALAENKDFAGRDIARKDFNSLDPTAGYERNKEGVSAVGDYVARAIDYVTGGNGYTAGTLSPTGDQIDYLIGQATGGVGRLALNTMATAQAAVTGEDLPNYKIPVVGRMIGDANEASAISGRFYDGIKEMNGHKKTVEGMEEDGKDTTSYFEDYPEAEFFDAAQEYESDISKLRKEKKQLKEDGASQQEIDYVTEEMQMLMVEFNQQIADYKKR
jgi:hypothetical protein